MSCVEIGVSVHCLTYNQVSYIRQCLDGFVMQKTTFLFEVIVHDDASTDGTSDIIREYETKYPNIIKPIYQKENQYSKGIPGYITDLVNKHCHGKYIAICEGDDYWTDPLKLQKQFDFMESHHDCSLCFHSFYYLDSDGELFPHKFNNQIGYSVKDFIWRGGEFVGTNTMFLRKELYLYSENKPDFWKYSLIGDLPLLLFCALSGKVVCLDGFMSVYRIQANGSWTSKTQSISKQILLAKSSILFWKSFNEYTHNKYFCYVLIKIVRIVIRCVRGVIRFVWQRLKRFFC